MPRWGCSIFFWSPPRDAADFLPEHNNSTLANQVAADSKNTREHRRSVRTGN
ncbi:hypothetical protein M378DRAFT_157459 [Amanita muscaria Koide BX008]|uniref:Uncharacterized protein n=1 Tax=Amanita muscaria (strain Koide BX008) TaxID=946122 RepID=A0A0C2TPR3_AMAMK|nr:hypothetical protein M378DRAFT_157459 [Amanita muscaria Koide BX008]